MVPLINKQSTTPFYQQLAAIIRKQVLYSEIKPGDRLPSENELVRQYMLSRSSVRQAIDILVAEGLVGRVQGKGNFIQNWHDAVSEGGTIGLLVPYERLSLFPNIINGVETAAKSRGYTLVLSYMGKDDREEIETIERMRSQNVSGLVIYPRNYIAYDEMIWQLHEDNYPFVLIDRYFTELPCSFVGVDNVSAMRRAVDYLVDLGHRTIGFVQSTDPVTTSIKERYVGYREALRHHGIQFNEKWLCYLPKIVYSPLSIEDDEEIEYHPFCNFLTQTERPTALIAINDYTAYLIYKAAVAEGVRIPGDMALMGFDNDEFARFNEVPLTTTEQPFKEIGARAANLLIDQMRGNYKGLEHVLLPTRLVARQSCGEPPRKT